MELSLTSWVVGAGALVVAAGTLGPWERVDTTFGTSMSGNSPTATPALLVLILLLLGGILALAWPVSDQRLSSGRCLGMTVMAVGLWAVPAIKWVSIATTKTVPGVSDSPGWGLYLTGLGLLVLTMGLILAWRGRGGLEVDEAADV